MEVKILVASLALICAPSASAQTQDVPAEKVTVPVNLAFADAVRCTTIYRALSAVSAEGSDIKNYTLLRAAQWGTATYGVFAAEEYGMSKDDISAHIQTHDTIVAGEIADARLASQTSGIETKLFETDLGKCNNLFNAHQPLFNLVNQALQKEFGE